MRPRFCLLLIAIIAATALLPLAARADGVIIVEPPMCDPGCFIEDQLVVKQHKVDVTIDNQIATTHIDQTFHNPNDWIAEGTYLFPVPVGATIDRFTMTVDGEEIEAKILDADEARAIYEEIVRTMRDPALLEYAGQNMIQARVFPIGPGEDRQVQIEYQQTLPVEQGLVRYVYPLSTEQFSAEPLEQVSVRVEVASNDPVRAVYSPSHQVAVDRPDDTHFVAGWEATNALPDTDFELIYTLSDELVGVNLLSEWDAAESSGAFLLLAAPGIEAASTPVAKDVIIVIDTSGSMEGEKMEQAREALLYILDHLNPEDRFAIIEFSTGVRLYDGDLQPATSAGDAVAWVESLIATGGTNINDALETGLSLIEPERPSYLLFLTDGLPTEGEVDTAAILQNVDAAAPDNVRLFSFGVGDDVDTILLDSLVAEHHGSSAYVRPGERLDEVVSAFYARVNSPVMTDLRLEIDGVTVEELYPEPLPDLFAGSQLIVAGRYRDTGPATVTLTGMVDGREVSFVYEAQPFSDESGDTGLARLWATRKIGYLLNQIRLHGESAELIDAVVDLSVRYGIVTPYTSYLITEDDILSASGREAAAEEALVQAQATIEPVSGAPAVDAAQAGGALQAADVAAPMEGIEGSERIRIVDNRTFVEQDGVWIDTRFDTETMETVKIVFASDEYFALLAEHPELAAAFALGDKVIALADGTAYEVG